MAGTKKHRDKVSSDYVRVVILNYNQSIITAKCVFRVLKQSYPFIEVVVVDNASSLKQIAMLKSMLPDDAKVIYNPINAGYAAGNNVGARLKGTLNNPAFIMIINNDVLLNDYNIIENLLEVLHKDENRVAVSPFVHNLSAKNITPEMEIQVRRDADFNACLISGSWWLRRLPVLKKIYDRHVYKDLRPFLPNREYDSDTINGCCFIIRADFLESIGYFDENTFMYFEEIILGRQIKKKNKKCCLLTSVTVDHYQGASTNQKLNWFPYQMYKEYTKSQLYYCQHYLHVGPFGCNLLRYVRLIDYFSKAIYFRVRGVSHAKSW